MRSVNKITKQAAKLQTRRCVVRVERMKSKNLRRSTSISAKAAEPTTSSKKRPGTAAPASKASTSLTTTLKAKDRRVVKTPIVSKNAVKAVEHLKKVATTPAAVDEELPPTIAVGRSRRVHKPNPKYANDDLLTPKSLIKSSSAVADDVASNKASNDSEMGVSRSAAKSASKTTSKQAKYESDSDFDEADIVDAADTDSSIDERQTRSRPAKAAAVVGPMARRSTVSAALNKTAPATANKGTPPTQLQQLRRTLNASNLASPASNRTTTTTATKAAQPTQLQKLRHTLNASNMQSPLAISKKRKLEESSPSSSSMQAVAAKRPNLTASTPKPLSTESSGALKRRQSPSVAPSDIKAKSSVSPAIGAGGEKQEKRTSLTSMEKKSSPLTLTRSASVANLKTMTSSKAQQSALQRGLMSRNNLSKASSLSTPSLSKSSSVGKGNAGATPPTASKTNKTSSNKTSPLSKEPNTAPAAARRTAPPENNDIEEYSSSDVEETPTITIDDFETMPTFTIVNINDIINKKGDVLISEDASADKDAKKPPAEPTKNVQKQQSQQQQQSKMQQNKLSPSQQNKTQSQQSKPLPKKQTAEGGQVESQPLGSSTPLLKKPTATAEKVAKTVAATKLINRNPPTGATTKASPPAALKSMTPLAASKPSTRSGSASINASGGEKKPAPRILNSVVSPRTKPIKPVIANLDVSDDDPSGSVSIYTDEDDYDDEDEDYEEDDGESMRLFKSDSKLTGESEYSDENESSELDDSPKKKKRVPPPQAKKSPATFATGGNRSKVSNSSSIPTNAAAKENSAAAVNKCLSKTKQSTTTTKQPPIRKLSPEKVVVQREGNKIIKKITCFETWYVINIPADAPDAYERNTLDMPLVLLANSAKTIKLPSDTWTAKVTLYELKKSMNKSNLTPYSGDLTEQNIKESDRVNYQPSCVMFRRTVPDRIKLQLPYDRAVIFKNKTFFTNIEGKNVKLVGAPTSIKEISEVETLLNIVDSLTLQSPFVEPASTIL